jgi:hypothetical protein
MDDEPSQAMKLLTPHLLNFPDLCSSFTARRVSSMGTERSGAWRYHKSTLSDPSAFKLSARPLRMPSGSRCVSGRPIQPCTFGKNLVSMMRPRSFHFKELRYSSEEPPLKVWISLRHSKVDVVVHSHRRSARYQSQNGHGPGRYRGLWRNRKDWRCGLVPRLRDQTSWRRIRWEERF